MKTAGDFINIQNDMESTRCNFNTQWQEIAERVWPDRATFTTKDRIEGVKTNQKVFDETATLALPKFASAIESLINPRTARWHGLGNRQLYNDRNAKNFYDGFTTCLFDMRYAPESNFASQAFECWMSVGAFGTGVLLVEDIPGYGVRYKSIHLAEVYMMENHVGNIDLVHRKFKLTSKQAVEQFGPEVLPTKIVDEANRAPNTRHEFLHCVHPNRIPDEAPFTSAYVCLETRTIVASGFYNSFPYLIGRYITTPDETYGRGPAMMVLNEIKGIQEMAKTMLKAGQLTVQPPLLLPEDGALNAFNFSPGALNFGGLDDRGQAMVTPLQTGARLDYGMEMMKEKRMIINDAFLINLFQILVDKPYMSATEAMLRAQEKGQLLAPTVGRLQSDVIGPLVRREIDIVTRSPKLIARWGFPSMPQSVVDLNGRYTIEYVAPLNKMQRYEDALGIQRTLEMITPLAQVDPSVLKPIDAHAILPIFAEANGAPAAMFKSEEQMAEDEQAAVEQAQVQQLLAAAPVIGKTAKDMAQAQQIAMNTPQSMGME